VEIKPRASLFASRVTPRTPHLSPYLFVLLEHSHARASAPRAGGLRPKIRTVQFCDGTLGRGNFPGLYSYPPQPFEVDDQCSLNSTVQIDYTQMPPGSHSDRQGRAEGSDRRGSDRLILPCVKRTGFLRRCLTMVSRPVPKTSISVIGM
jgi:hypothetical protein